MGWPHISWTGGTRGREVNSSMSNRLLVSEAEWFLVCRGFSRGLGCVRRWNQAQSNFITMSITLTLLNERARRGKVYFSAFIFINWTYTNKQDLLAMVKCYLKPYGIKEGNFTKVSVFFFFTTSWYDNRKCVFEGNKYCAFNKHSHWEPQTPISNL